jgi:Raf kinase inhibitor-like YbhB/YbcL family protein
MKLESRSFADGARIPETFAAGIPGPNGPTVGPNKSPHLAWSGAPAGTKSFAIVCHDRDVPSKPDDVNKSDRSVPYDLPRVDFYHWLLVDVPASRSELLEGADSSGFVPKGKPIGKTDHGRRGVNSYTDWFGADPAMGGDYGGYDGPWPPFNDERLHHYTFTVYAIDVENVDLKERFTGPDLLGAIKGHVLAQATWAGTYSIYEDAKP